MILFGFLVSFIKEILTVFFLILFILSAALCKVTLYVLLIFLDLELCPWAPHPFTLVPQEIL